MHEVPLPLAEFPPLLWSQPLLDLVLSHQTGEVAVLPTVVVSLVSPEKDELLLVGLEPVEDILERPLVPLDAPVCESFGSIHVSFSTLVS